MPIRVRIENFWEKTYHWRSMRRERRLGWSGRVISRLPRETTRWLCLAQIVFISSRFLRTRRSGIQESFKERRKFRQSYSPCRVNAEIRQTRKTDFQKMRGQIQKGGPDIAQKEQNAWKRKFGGMEAKGVRRRELASFTHVYLLIFEDTGARDAYLPHPEHKKFVSLLDLLTRKAALARAFRRPLARERSTWSRVEAQLDQGPVEHPLSGVRMSLMVIQRRE